jgi:hypothetical protein
MDPEEALAGIELSLKKALKAKSRSVGVDKNDKFRSRSPSPSPTPSAQDSRSSGSRTNSPRNLKPAASQDQDQMLAALGNKLNSLSRISSRDRQENKGLQELRAAIAKSVSKNNIVIMMEDDNENDMDAQEQEEQDLPPLEDEENQEENELVEEENELDEEENELDEDEKEDEEEEVVDEDKDEKEDVLDEEKYVDADEQEEDYMDNEQDEEMQNKEMQDDKEIAERQQMQVLLAVLKKDVARRLSERSTSGSSRSNSSPGRIPVGNNMNNKDMQDKEMQDNEEIIKAQQQLQARLAVLKNDVARRLSERSTSGSSRSNSSPCRMSVGNDMNNKGMQDKEMQYKEEVMKAQQLQARLEAADIRMSQRSTSGQSRSSSPPDCAFVGSSGTLGSTSSENSILSERILQRLNAKPKSGELVSAGKRGHASLEPAKKRARTSSTVINVQKGVTANEARELILQKIKFLKDEKTLVDKKERSETSRELANAKIREKIKTLSAKNLVQVTPSPESPKSPKSSSHSSQKQTKSSHPSGAVGCMLTEKDRLRVEKKIAQVMDEMRNASSDVSVSSRGSANDSHAHNLNRSSSLPSPSSRVNHKSPNKVTKKPLSGYFGRLVSDLKQNASRMLSA